MYQIVQTANAKSPKIRNSNFLRCQSDFVRLDVSTTCFRNNMYSKRCQQCILARNCLTEKRVLF